MPDPYRRHWWRRRCQSSDTPFPRVPGVIWVPPHVRCDRTKLRDSHCVHRPHWWPFGTILGKALPSSSTRRTERPSSISMPVLDAPKQRRSAAAKPRWPQHRLISVSALACTPGCLLAWSSRPKWCLQGKVLTFVTPEEIPAPICPPNCLCRHFCPWGAPQTPRLQLLVHKQWTHLALGWPYKTVLTPPHLLHPPVESKPYKWRTTMNILPSTTEPGSAEAFNCCHQANID